jgi:hypothetical protein
VWPCAESSLAIKLTIFCGNVHLTFFPDFRSESLGLLALDKDQIATAKGPEAVEERETSEEGRPRHGEVDEFAFEDGLMVVLRSLNQLLMAYMSVSKCCVWVAMRSLSEGLAERDG